MNVETNELVAGRELDLLVAMKVMGWPICDQRFLKWTVSGMTVWDCPAHGADGCVSDTSVPTFSTQIGNAWQVVERMRTKGVFMAVCSGELDWLVEIGEGNTFLADTAPLAICAAALKAATASAVPP